MLHGLYVTPENEGFSTDLYQLTMAAAYWTHRMNEESTFELYFRRLPKNRSFVLATGLEQVLHYIQNLHFTNDQIEWLRSQPQFHNVDLGFFQYLKNFRFSGDIYAVPEGTPVFPLEPILQVRARLIEAQILETHVLALLNMQSLIATKAARIVHSARGRSVIDFGTRRAHGPQAGLLAARASYVGGCKGTSNVLAGQLANIPVYGTAAHSFTMAFEHEIDAFRAYFKVFPDSTTLLIDTYDTVAAAKKVKDVASNVKGVRIDSGDLVDLTGKVRSILDQDGLKHVKIFVSGDLNEYKIHDLMAANAPIDFFGVGTELVTSYDDPALSGVYKLVEATTEGKLHSRIKTSHGKLSYPGKKQIYRFLQGSYYSHDMMCLFDEQAPTGGIPLLECYCKNGKVVEELPGISEIQNRAQFELHRLSHEFQDLTQAVDYPVGLSDKLLQELSRLQKEFRAE